MPDIAGGGSTDALLGRIEKQAAELDALAQRVRTLEDELLNIRGAARRTGEVADAVVAMLVRQGPVDDPVVQRLVDSLVNEV
jgi:hypothetical protein